MNATDPKADPEPAMKRLREEQQRALVEHALDEAQAQDQPQDEDQPKKKRKRGKSPTALSLAYCRKRGWLPSTVEQTIPHTFIKRDLFGFIDIVALDGRRGLLGIQATGGASGVAGQRMEKISGKDSTCVATAKRWLLAGLRLEVWHWRPTNNRTPGAKKVQTLRRLKAELVDGEISWDDVEETA